MWRVFMCAGGACGERRCATSEMPLAQNRPSASAPGIWPRNSGLNSPQTVETFTPTFSNTRPRMIADHAAAAAGPVPGLPLEPARRQVGVRGAGIVVLDRLEGGADPVAQLLEPGAGRLAARCGRRRSRRDLVDSRPSAAAPRPATIAAAIATLSERSPGRSGIRTRRSARRWTAPGTPALSLPSIRMSSGMNADAMMAVLPCRAQ